MGKLSKKTKKFQAAGDEGGEGGEGGEDAPQAEPERRQRAATKEKSDEPNNKWIEDNARGGTDDDCSDEADAAAAECDSPEHELATLRLHSELPVTVKHLYTMLFTDCPLYRQLLAARQVSNLNQEDWQPSEEEGQKESRNLTYTIQVNTVVAKEINISEAQTVRACSRGGSLYSLDVCTSSSGAPYADSFTVLAHYCLRRVSRSSCSLTLLAHVHYTKSVWAMVKSMIEKQSTSGLQDSFVLIKRLATSSSEASFGSRSSPSRDVTPVTAITRRKKLVQQEKCVERGCRAEGGAEGERGCGGGGAGGGGRWLLALVVLLLNLNVLLYWELARSEAGYYCAHQHTQLLLLKAEEAMSHEAIGSLPPSGDLATTLADIVQSDRVLNKLWHSQKSKLAGGGGKAEEVGETGRGGKR